MHPSVKELYTMLASCSLCPNNCGVNRLAGEKGICGLTDKPMVSSCQLHFGEEPELVGRGGSGTIFFSGCNLKCLFCQNYQISWQMHGSDVTLGELASMMLALQWQGAENINLVTPTPQTPWIFEAIEMARNRGLKLPIVYNSGGYESLKVLQLIQGMVDIYLPDFKYGDNSRGSRLSGIQDYFTIAKAAIQEMQRQQGNLATDSRGVAIKGLIIRHLVLPGHLADSKKVLDSIYNEISPHSHVNIMGQYHPWYRASEIAELRQHSVRSEYQEVAGYARQLGMGSGLR